MAVKEKLYYDTPLYTFEGITAAARDYARALSKYFDIMLADTQFQSIFGKEFKDMYNVIDMIEDDYFILKNTRPEYWVYAKKSTKPMFGYHVFEGDRLISQHATAVDMSPISALFVPSEYNKKACLASGVRKPIEVIPHIIKPEFVPGEPKKDDGITKFYCSGAIYGLSNKDRKGLDVMLDAWRPFANDEDKQLILKINTKYADAMYQAQGQKFDTMEYLTKVFQGNLPKNIKVITETMDREELVKLYQSMDCVILPSRSEGFGLIPFEALACGIPCIVTEKIGCEQYLKELKGGYLSLKTKGPVMPEKRFPYYNGTEYTLWLEPDTTHLRECMKNFLDNKEQYKKEALEASKVIHKKFSYEVIGKYLYDIMKKYEGKESS